MVSCQEQNVKSLKKGHWKIVVDKGILLWYNTCMASNPLFRTSMGARRSRALFYELWINLPVADRPEAPVFSLHIDRPGVLNLGRVYVELADPTGYKLSQLYLESYDHWTFLMRSSWFREAKEIWDVELDAKLASEGLDTIRSFSEGIEGVPSSVTLAAAKFLANKDYKAKRTGAGRPTKAEIAGNLKTETEAAQTFADDAARITTLRSIT